MSPSPVERDAHGCPSTRVRNPPTAARLRTRATGDAATLARGPTSRGKDESVTLLLDRLIQRIFTAGLHLHDASSAGGRSPGVEGALEQLDAALNDVHAAARLCAEVDVDPGSGPGRAQGADMSGASSVFAQDRAVLGDGYAGTDLDTAAGLLVNAAASLDRLVARGPAPGDGIRWVEANDAGHMVSRALVVLQQALTERPDPSRREALAGTPLA